MSAYDFLNSCDESREILRNVRSLLFLLTVTPLYNYLSDSVCIYSLYQIVYGLARNLLLQFKMNGFYTSFPNHWTFLLSSHNMGFHLTQCVRISLIDLSAQTNFIWWNWDLRQLAHISAGHLRWGLILRNPKSWLPVLSVNSMTIFLPATALIFSFRIRMQYSFSLQTFLHFWTSVLLS